VTGLLRSSLEILREVDEVRERIDVTPARQRGEVEPVSLAALRRVGEDPVGTPGDVVEQRRLGGAQSDEVVAAVFRRAEDDIRALVEMRESGADEGERQCRCIRAHGDDGAESPRAQGREDRSESCTKITIGLRHERYPGPRSFKELSVLEWRVRDDDLHTIQASEAFERIPEERVMERRRIRKRQRWTQARLHPTWPRCLGDDDDRELSGRSTAPDHLEPRQQSRRR